MKRTISSFIFSLNALLVLGILSFIPKITLAQNLTFNIKSPLNGITSFQDLITAILGAMIVIATPIVVIMIVYAGFLYVTAQGNAEQVKKATRALTYAIIGGILIIGAVAIAGIIEGIVDAFKAP